MTCSRLVGTSEMLVLFLPSSCMCNCIVASCPAPVISSRFQPLLATSCLLSLLPLERMLQRTRFMQGRHSPACLAHAQAVQKHTGCCAGGQLRWRNSPLAEGRQQLEGSCGLAECCRRVLTSYAPAKQRNKGSAKKALLQGHCLIQSLQAQELCF